MRCPECDNRKVSISDNFCSYCGVKIEKPEEAERRKEEVERKEREALEVLRKSFNKLTPIDDVNASLDFLISMENKGLIVIRPFPQGKQIFIGLRTE